MKKTEISGIGEFKLIDRITKKFKAVNNTTILSIGDDCAIISQSNDYQSVITSDLLLEGIHFDLTYCPLKYLGCKAVVVNLSDIYAMNAIPEQITVSIGISSKFSVEMIEELYEGILSACNFYKVDLVGGDTSSSVSGLMISITAIGKVEKNKSIKRSTANKFDLICVSGNLGAAYLGLMILEREKNVFETSSGIKENMEKYTYLLQRQLKPEARYDIIDKLKEIDVTPTSMIDISDGLSSELLHICQNSGKGCKIYEDKIPISIEAIEASKELNIEPIIAALNGGEDYELLFTIDINDYSKISLIEDVTVIGNICDKEKFTSLITQNGNSISLKAQGWNGFTNKS